jgi:hypothetical protein
MERVFKFKQGEYWDGDEMIIHVLEEILLDWETNENFPTVKNDCKVTLNFDWKSQSKPETNK